MIYGENECSNQGHHLSSSPVLPLSPDGTIGGVEIGYIKLRDPTQSLARKQRGTDLVGHSDGEVDSDLTVDLDESLAEV